MSKRILLIEDNADDALLAGMVFDKCRVTPEVQVVQDGQSALDFIFGQGNFAAQGPAKDLKLIFLDLNVPKLSGAEVLERLRANEATRTLPVVALTITGREREVLENPPYNVYDYLRKPLELHSFLTLYRKYVESAPSSP